MTARLVLRPEAEADLLALQDYIALQSGVPVAIAYLARLETALLAMTDFPLRGTMRDDLAEEFD